MTTPAWKQRLDITTDNGFMNAYTGNDTRVSSSQPYDGVPQGAMWFEAGGNEYILVKASILNIYQYSKNGDSVQPHLSNTNISNLGHQGFSGYTASDDTTVYAGTAANGFTGTTLAQNISSASFTGAVTVASTLGLPQGIGNFCSWVVGSEHVLGYASDATTVVITARGVDGTIAATHSNGDAFSLVGGGNGGTTFGAVSTNNSGLAVIEFTLANFTSVSSVANYIWFPLSTNTNDQRSIYTSATAVLGQDGLYAVFCGGDTRDITGGDKEYRVWFVDWALLQAAGPGDCSSVPFVQSFTLKAPTDADGYAVQGVTWDGEYLHCFYGQTAARGHHWWQKYDFAGNLISQLHIDGNVALYGYNGLTGVPFAGTGSVSGTTLTVTAITQGSMFPGLIFSGSAHVSNNTTVVGPISASPDGLGTWEVDTSQTAASGALAGFMGISSRQEGEGITVNGDGEVLVFETDTWVRPYPTDYVTDGVNFTGVVTTGVTAVTVTAAGSGYSNGANVSFSGGGGTGAAGTVTVDGSGKVQGVVLTSTGSGYTSAPTVTITAVSGGSGATASATFGAVCNASSISTGFIQQGQNLYRGSTGAVIGVIWNQIVTTPGYPAGLNGSYAVMNSTGNFTSQSMFTGLYTYGSVGNNNSGNNLSDTDNWGLVQNATPVSAWQANALYTPPLGTVTCSITGISGNQVTIGSASSNSIVKGMPLFDSSAGVPLGIVLGQVSGTTGGNGVYTLSASPNSSHIGAAGSFGGVAITYHTYRLWAVVPYDPTQSLAANEYVTNSGACQYLPVHGDSFGGDLSTYMNNIWGSNWHFRSLSAAEGVGRWFDGFGQTQQSGGTPFWWKDIGWESDNSAECQLVPTFSANNGRNTSFYSEGGTFIDGAGWQAYSATDPSFPGQFWIFASGTSHPSVHFNSTGMYLYQADQGNVGQTYDINGIGIRRVFNTYAALVAAVPSPVQGMQVMIKDSTVAATGNYFHTISSGGGSNHVPLMCVSGGWVIA